MSGHPLVAWARRIRWCCAGLGLLLAQAATAQEWPTPPLPQRLQTFDIGQQMTVNGLPMRVQGFLSAQQPAELARSFRDAWGQPLVENIVGRQLVLGQLRGEHYVSVQLEVAGKGTRGVIAVTHLKAAYDGQEQTRHDRERLQSRLPAGSRILSFMTSQDGPRLSRHLVFENAHGEGLNREYLVSLLAQEGLALQNSLAQQQPAADVPAREHPSLYFKGPRKEAIATLSRNSAGQTTTVLNIITASP